MSARVWMGVSACAWMFSALATQAVAGPACGSDEACVKACGDGDNDACAVAVPIFERACREHKLGTGCMMASIAHDSGLGVARSVERAAEYAQLGCELDHGGACNNWGLALVSGVGVAKDEQQGIAAWQKSCRLKSANGCTNIGGRLMHGVGIARDEPAAAEALTLGCDLGSGTACFFLGDLYARGIAGARDEKRAAAAYQAGCKLGVSETCALAKRLGEAGGTVDVVAETTRFRKSCDEGVPGACSEYASRLIEGTGVRRNAKRGLALRKKTCRGGHSPSCYRLAMDLLGPNKAQRKQALGFFRLACSFEDSESCNQVGFMLGRGDGAKLDHAAAASFYDKACAMNHPGACSNLGTAFYLGNGVEPDKARGVDLWDRACILGNLPACGSAESGLRQRGEMGRAAEARKKACELGNSEACTAP